ncbi:MAG: fibrobacter succinogenes major paralogous domain-containing protein [Chitinispirillia bacterium]|nr:fibrobacter succinogenes major paralogous domain-containing protein [Chitinispirillia bacterium]MCL2267739.1 fibrobacter succinogenes major paralogous domain-containing protein [Chitinispirillia bacterium]
MSVSVSGRRAGHRVRVVFGAVVAVVLLSVSAVNAQMGSFTDPRDGKKYRTVRIGNLTWMAQNLNYATPGGSFCYDDDLSNCEKYGRLYDWKTAMKACPTGWRLPARKDWDNLAQAVGGQRKELDNGVAYWSGVGKKLKSKTGWSDVSCDKDLKEALNALGEDCVLGKMIDGNGTDNFGFSALPGGVRLTNGSFYRAGNYGYWWSATEYGSGLAYSRYMYSGRGYVLEYTNGKGTGFSALCVQD